MPLSDSYNKYNRSEKGRIRRDRYERSEKASLRQKRYDQSGKGRARHERLYARYGGKGAYEMERYYKIQAEAGYYHHITTFYPGHRFLKALETAEVVEIKL